MSSLNFVRRLSFAFIAAMLLVTLAHIGNAAAQTAPAAAIIKLNVQEQALFDKINAARKTAGAAQVTLSPVLVDLTRYRASDMAKRNYFAHVTPEGTSLMDWLVARNVDFQDAGEIIHRNTYSLATTADQAFQGYFNSKVHHDIMLDPIFSQAGVGMASDGNGKNYFVVIFIQPY